MLLLREAFNTQINDKFKKNCMRDLAPIPERNEIKFRSDNLVIGLILSFIPDAELF